MRRQILQHASRRKSEPRSTTEFNVCAEILDPGSTIACHKIWTIQGLAAPIDAPLELKTISVTAVRKMRFYPPSPSLQARGVEREES
jgi:hypothetical protein